MDPVQKSLQEGAVPDDWKRANVTPIFKKGSRGLLENYRPVSLTSQCSKLFEAIIRDSLTDYLESNCTITDSQRGFRTGRSCMSNLLSFLVWYGILEFNVPLGPSIRRC